MPNIAAKPQRLRHLFKAKTACEVSGYPASDHFVGATKMVCLGSDSQRDINDLMFTRPSRNLPKFIGTEPIAEDGVAFQRHIRDTEWP